VAGRWMRTRTPGVYVQNDSRTGNPRYKAAFRNSRGVVTSRTFLRLRDAEQHLADMRIKRARGAFPDTSLNRHTVEDLFCHMLTTGRQRPSTRAWYEARWAKHVAPVLAKRRVGSVSRSELAEFLADLESRTSLSTRRAVQQLLHKLFAVGVRYEWLSRNPADAIDMPAPVAREARFLTEEEVGRIAAEAPPRYEALVWTLAVSGLRIGEACALRVKNVGSGIRITENSVEVRGTKMLGAPKTVGSERLVPIPPSLQRMLEVHISEYSASFDGQAFVFQTSTGAQIGQNVWRKRVFQPAARRAGIDPAPRVHDLRHTAAALMLKHGMTPFEVARVLGHSSVAMVERIYGHLYESALQAKVDGLDAVFDRLIVNDHA
jgi:integrase